VSVAEFKEKLGLASTLAGSYAIWYERRAVPFDFVGTNTVVTANMDLVDYQLCGRGYYMPENCSQWSWWCFQEQVESAGFLWGSWIRILLGQSTMDLCLEEEVSMRNSWYWREIWGVLSRV
jgi:hypothetical protein